MKNVLIVLLALYGFMSSASAYNVSIASEPISVSSELSSWYWKYMDYVEEDFKKRVNSTECKKVKELNGLLLCNSYLAKTMNSSLARASIFVEGLFNQGKGTLLKVNNPLLSTSGNSIGGHDLQKSDLKRFLKVVDQKCSKDSLYCLNNAEVALFEKLRPYLESKSNFVIITFSIQGHMAYDVVVSHEILHAQYFLDSKYQNVVDSYWLKLKTDEKEKIRNELSSQYDVADDFLIKNEFQAYILQYDPYNGLLSDFVQKYRSSLMSKMKEAGVVVFQVKTN